MAHSNISKFNEIVEKYIKPTKEQTIRGIEQEFIFNVPQVLENFYKNCYSFYISKEDVLP